VDTCLKELLFRENTSVPSRGQKKRSVETCLKELGLGGVFLSSTWGSCKRKRNRIRVLLRSLITRHGVDAVLAHIRKMCKGVSRNQLWPSEDWYRNVWGLLQEMNLTVVVGRESTSQELAHLSGKNHSERSPKIIDLEHIPKKVGLPNAEAVQEVIDAHADGSCVPCSCHHNPRCLLSDACTRAKARYLVQAARDGQVQIVHEQVQQRVDDEVALAHKERNAAQKAWSRGLEEVEEDAATSLQLAKSSYALDAIENRQVDASSSEHDSLAHVIGDSTVIAKWNAEAVPFVPRCLHCSGVDDHRIFPGTSRHQSREIHDDTKAIEELLKLLADDD